METTFTNVTITIVAPNAVAAYAKLAALLDSPDVEYTTHEFDAGEGPINTVRLFPS